MYPPRVAKIQDLIPVPERLAAAHAGAMLPSEGSEDVREMMVHPALRVPDPGSAAGPDETVDWAITATLSAPVTRAAFDEVFSAELLAELGGATIYVATAGDAWTPLDDDDDEIGAVAVAFPFVDEPDDGDPATTWTAEDYVALGDVVQDALVELGADEVEETYLPQDAAEHEAALRWFKQTCGAPVAVYLVAPDGRPYDGRAVWDVMMSLGLRWGNGDRFEHVVGDGRDQRQIFTVGTSTAPGYFLPETIARGTAYEDLIFVFHPARVREPAVVLEVMRRAVGYAKHRLGGRDLRDDHEPFPWDACVQSLRGFVAALTKVGLAPGTRAARRLF